MKTSILFLSIAASLSLFHVTPSLAQSSLTNGLVAYYQFTGNANDASGNGNNGQAISVTQATDRFGTSGNAFQFDGTNSAITVASLSSVNLPELTLSVWVKQLADPADNEILVDKWRGYSYSLEDFSFWLEADLRVAFSNGRHGTGYSDLPNHCQLRSANTISLGRWYHLVATLDSAGTAKLWINGILSATDNILPLLAPAPEPVRIGSGLLATNPPFNGAVSAPYNGSMDDVRIYNRALTATEVGMLYELERPKLTDGLVAYYPFNGNANDESGNGGNGTVFGAQLTDDRLGQVISAYVFNGLSDYIEIPESSAFDSTNYTVSLWFNAFQFPTGVPTTGDGNFLISKGQHNFEIHTGSPLVSGVTGIRFLPRFDAIPSGTWDTGPGAYVTNSWHHLVAIWNPAANKIQVFINGQEQTVLGPPVTVAGADNSALFRIGMRFDGTLPFLGKIDDIRIYDRALSATEAGSLYDLERPKLTDGLVAYYPFNGNANDESGNANDGIVADATLTADRFGLASRAYNFASLGQSITTSNANGFPLSTNDFAVSLWVSVASNSSTHQVFLCNAAIEQFQIHIGPFQNGQTQIGFQSGGTGAGYTPFIPWTLNHWYNVQVVRSQNVISIYRDGVQLSQQTTTLGNQAQPADQQLIFGYRPSSANQLYGQLDDIRIYKRALSAGEVQQLYDYENGPKVGLIKAVKPWFSNLYPGTNYQLQLSADLNTWTNHGSAFTATNANMVYPQYWDVDNWGKLFFRLLFAP